MIPNIVFIVTRYVFLAILFIFIFLVVRAIYRDLRAPAAPTAREPRRRRREPQLILVEGSKNLEAKPKITAELSLGRSPLCQVVLDDTYASQKHARFFRQGERVLVEDLGSTNGTYVNGRKINYPVELRSGDRIKLGKTVYEFRE